MPHPLRPFPDPTTTHLSPISIQAQIDRTPTTLSITFTLSGPLSTILLPPPAAAPARRDNLWQSTCFEAFIGPAGRPDYVELNVSPALDWNLYRFSDYRAGMSPVEGTPVSARLVHSSAASFILESSIALPPDFASAPLDVNVTAVIEERAGRRSFWALAHTAERPDFHRRDAFVARR